MESHFDDALSEGEHYQAQGLSNSFAKKVVPETNKKLEGVLYWSNESNRNEKRLKDSLKRLFSKHPALKEKYQKHSEGLEDQLDKFLNDFFIENISLPYFLANLSIKDAANERINLAIRIPNHGEFLGYLPPTSTICIRGFWGVNQRNPVFIPEDIFTSFNDEHATNYEETLTSASSIRPERRCTDNILTRELAAALPAISVKAAERLEAWQEFLTFKKQLFDRKTIGLRYLECTVTPENNLAFLVVSEDAQLINQAGHLFKRKSLEAYELGISQNKWDFTLDANKKSTRIPQGEELGQLKGKINKLDAKTLKENTSHINFLNESGIKDPTLAYLVVEPSEDWKNKLDNAQRHFELIEHEHEGEAEETLKSSDDETEFDRVINALLNAIPKQGFISFPSVGDLALIKRHEQTVKNLRQNESCYSPYLSSYLFDITQANQSTNDAHIASWFNEQLNDSQKLAVNKMMSAPDLCLVQGPPGTGKTTVIAEAILQLARRGETILLASQSHDAIDNALSCIKNRPELRAIRLARGQGKITEEGKGFAEDKALERYYSSLSTYVSQQWLEPKKQRDKEFTQLRLWIDEADYVSADLEYAQSECNDLRQQRSVAKARLSTEQRAYKAAVTNYEALAKQKTATKSSLLSIESQKWELSHDSFLPKVSQNLLQALQRMSVHNISVDPNFLEFNQFNNQNSCLLVLNALLDTWANVKRILPAISTDLLRLRDAGAGALQDTAIREELALLKIRETELANRMDEDDTEELAQQWREVRRHIKKLKNQATGLDASTYNCFVDCTHIINVIDASKTYVLLATRLHDLEVLDKEINNALNIVADQLKQWLIEYDAIKAPADEQIKEIEASLSQIEKKLISQTRRLESLQASASRLVSQRYDDTTLSLSECLIKAKKDYEEQMYVAMEEDKRQAPMQNFLSDWKDNLTRESSAQYDWEHVSETFVENCNLVAISCNESDRTLRDAGMESFDTVIIDEVSKATPVELLLPLMRARRAVLVGDHRQLPPVFQESQDAQAFTDKVEESEDDAAETLLTKVNLQRFEKMVTASLFKEHFENADESIKERLTTQYRMHPQIMSFVNHFYDGQLICGNKDKDRSHNIVLKSRNNRLLSANDHVLWIDTSLDLKRKPFKESEDRTNRLEAELIAKTLVEINQQYSQQGFGKQGKKKQEVGVVSFYAAQCRVIREAIKRHNHGKVQFNAIHIEINTVIRYQGKEKPIILMSLVRNDGGPKERRRSAKANIARYEFINVAMSRAQNLLIVFGARNMLETRDIWLPNMDKPGKQKKQVYRQIFAQLDREAGIFDAAEFAEQFAYTTPLGKGVQR